MKTKHTTTKILLACLSGWGYSRRNMSSLSEEIFKERTRMMKKFKGIIRAAYVTDMDIAATKAV